GLCHHGVGRRYYAKLIETEEHYVNTLEYVLQNPVRAGLARYAADWPWTSVPTARPIHSPHVARHGQADPPALARRVPDGGTATADRARRQVQRRGLLGDVGRGLRPPLLLRPRG